MAKRRKPIDAQRLQQLATQIDVKQEQLETAQANAVMANSVIDKLLNEMDALKQEFVSAVSDYAK